jgi:hypothetical protein
LIYSVARQELHGSGGMPFALSRDAQSVRLPAYAAAMILAVAPIASLIAGILILVIPRLLNYIVALYLIVIGIVGLFPGLTS